MAEDWRNGGAKPQLSFSIGLVFCFSFFFFAMVWRPLDVLRNIQQRRYEWACRDNGGRRRVCECGCGGGGG